MRSKCSSRKFPKRATHSRSVWSVIFVFESDKKLSCVSSAKKQTKNKNLDTCQKRTPVVDGGLFLREFSAACKCVRALNAKVRCMYELLTWQMHGALVFQVYAIGKVQRRDALQLAEVPNALVADGVLRRPAHICQISQTCTQDTDKRRYPK